MTAKDARKALNAHIHDCGMLMPEYWLQTHGEDSQFQQAMRKVFELLDKEMEREKR